MKVLMYCWSNSDLTLFRNQRCGKLRNEIRSHGQIQQFESLKYLTEKQK